MRLWKAIKAWCWRNIPVWSNADYGDNYANGFNAGNERGFEAGYQAARDNPERHVGDR